MNRKLKFFLFGVVGFILLCVIVAAVQDQGASAGFEIGKQYSTGKDFVLMCATPDALTHAQYQAAVTGITMQSQASSLGCRLLDKGAPVTMLEKNAALIRVRSDSTPGDTSSFEGWMNAGDLAGN